MDEEKTEEKTEEQAEQASIADNGEVEWEHVDVDDLYAPGPEKMTHEEWAMEASAEAPGPPEPDRTTYTEEERSAEIDQLLQERRARQRAAQGRIEDAALQAAGQHPLTIQLYVEQVVRLTSQLEEARIRASEVMAERDSLAVQLAFADTEVTRHEMRAIDVEAALKAGRVEVVCSQCRRSKDWEEPPRPKVIPIVGKVELVGTGEPPARILPPLPRRRPRPATPPPTSFADLDPTDLNQQSEDPETD